METIISIISLVGGSVSLVGLLSGMAFYLSGLDGKAFILKISAALFVVALILNAYGS